MSVQLNLAPGVYQANQQQKRRKRLATTLGIAVNAGLLGLIVIGFLGMLGQKAALSIINNQITSKQNQVAQSAGLQQAATAQAHLASLVQLTNNKPKFSNFFAVLQQFAPQGVTASSITVGAANTIQLTATASSYSLVTKFVDVLEAASNTQGNQGGSAGSQPYFTNVQLSSVGAASNGGGVGFQLTAQLSSEVTSGQ